MAELRRTSTSARRRVSSSRHSAWCCSFVVPPASPDLRSSPLPPSKSLKNPPTSTTTYFHSSPSPAASAAKLGRSIIVPRRILSPGRVSPIDSDGAPSLAPLPELPGPPPPGPQPEISPAETITCQLPERASPSMDLRIRVGGRDGRFLVLELDSGVLRENSEVFRKLVADSGRGEEGWREVEVGEVEDLGAFRETIEMMYSDEGEGEGLMRWLARAGVSRSIDVLEVSSKIMFDRGVVSCLNYIEAVPWSEDEEEKLKDLFTRCTFDKAVTQDILARLPPGGLTGSEDLAVHLIQSIADGANGSARKDLQSLVNGLLSKSSVYQKDPAGLDKERLYSICNSCLDSLVEHFEEAADPNSVNRSEASKQMKPLVERISKQVENLNWLLEILIDRHMAEDFVSLWAGQKELIRMHQRASPMVRYELSRISAGVFIALGKGKVRCHGDVRFAVLEAWFGPMLVDFGWLQRCSKGLDVRLLEEGLGQALLTLPLKQQQSLFVEWFRCFGGKGTECPNLSNAFQVWWRRSFVRTAETHT
ncbi:BTB/POZ domain-containing protein [Iris pallida]|uniref:BTB/POZ domain-containing protein n=1 Tax=Iris pallida TaxID=29817 RepID=A0AAX6EPC2_IRIPA|nr:BTB/POZ domain-containing protein [Iris pallida]